MIWIFFQKKGFKRKIQFCILQTFFFISAWFNTLSLSNSDFYFYFLYRTYKICLKLITNQKTACIEMSNV